jgi:hypothetical protein
LPKTALLLLFALLVGRNQSFQISQRACRVRREIGVGSPTTSIRPNYFSRPAVESNKQEDFLVTDSINLQERPIFWQEMNNPRDGRYALSVMCHTAYLASASPFASDKNT